MGGSKGAFRARISALLPLVLCLLVAATVAARPHTALAAAAAAPGPALSAAAAPTAAAALTVAAGRAAVAFRETALRLNAGMARALQASAADEWDQLLLLNKISWGSGSTLAIPAGALAGVRIARPIVSTLFTQVFVTALRYPALTLLLTAGQARSLSENDEGSDGTANASANANGGGSGGGSSGGGDSGGAGGRALALRLRSQGLVLRRLPARPPLWLAAMTVAMGPNPPTLFAALRGVPFRLALHAIANGVAASCLITATLCVVGFNSAAAQYSFMQVLVGRPVHFLLTWDAMMVLFCMRSMLAPLLPGERRGNGGGGGSGGGSSKGVASTGGTEGGSATALKGGGDGSADGGKARSAPSGDGGQVDGGNKKQMFGSGGFSRLVWQFVPQAVVLFVAGHQDVWRQAAESREDIAAASDD